MVVTWINRSVSIRSFLTDRVKQFISGMYRERWPLPRDRGDTVPISHTTPCSAACPKVDSWLRSLAGDMGLGNLTTNRIPEPYQTTIRATLDFMFCHYLWSSRNHDVARTAAQHRPQAGLTDEIGAVDQLYAATATKIPTEAGRYLVQSGREGFDRALL